MSVLIQINGQIDSSGKSLFPQLNIVQSSPDKHHLCSTLFPTALQEEEQSVAKVPGAAIMAFDCLHFKHILYRSNLLHTRYTHIKTNAKNDQVNFTHSTY